MGSVLIYIILGITIMVVIFIRKLSYTDEHSQSIILYNKRLYKWVSCPYCVNLLITNGILLLRHITTKGVILLRH